MRLTERDIYERVARQELSVEAAMALLAELDRGAERPEPVEAPAPAQAGESFDAQVRRFLEERLRRVLQLTGEIPVDRGFMNLGASSASLLGATRELERELGVELFPTIFFEHGNLEALAAYFVETHADRLHELLDARPMQQPAPVHREPPPASRASIAAPPSPASSRTSRAPARERSPGAAAPGDIAIVGVSGRYPGARNLREFWRVLSEGRDCITEIPRDRWDHARYFDPDREKPGGTYSKWGGFLDDVDKFDALFFNVSPREAELLDPQERLFLETAWGALEDAGYTRVGMRRGGLRPEDAGVFVGVMWSNYQLYGAEEGRLGHGPLPTSAHWSIANRVSYFFDFQGPSLAVDTACSSSLTALHLACESLRSGNCRLAIAGGVNLSTHPYKYLALAQGRFVSSDGRCRSFGKGGDGYVPGEGVGAVVLRTLEDAERDGDTIYAVIKGTAINHGGHANGFTVPNPNAQAALIRRALERSGVEPSTISYIEAHGTGTALGDPIEIAGLTQAFREHMPGTGVCPIGSVKSNIGHLESAAGIAALTKVLLQLEHRTLVPSLHSTPANPHIDFASTPFQVVREAAEWRRPVRGDGEEVPRRAAVSSFGAGGSNGHVIIEEYRDTRRSTAAVSAARELVLLSAKNRERLREHAAHHLEWLAENPPPLGDVAYTLQVAREAMPERLALLVRDHEELRAKLTAFVERGELADGVYAGTETNGPARLRGSEAEDQAYVRSLFEAGKLDRLASFWASGSELDWNQLRGSAGRRVALPTYPFARERYWIEEVASAPRADVVAPAPRFNCLAREWRPSPLAGAAAPLGSRRLVVLHDASAPEALRRALAKLVPDRLCVIEVGRVGRPASSGRPALDRDDLDAGAALAREVLASVREVEGVLDLCDLTRADDGGRVEYGRIGFYQGALAERGTAPFLLLHVTAGLLSGETLAGAPLHGLVTAIAGEYRGVSARSIDVERGDLDPERLFALLADEAAAVAGALTDERRTFDRNGQEGGRAASATSALTDERRAVDRNRHARGSTESATSALTDEPRAVDRNGHARGSTESATSALTDDRQARYRNGQREVPTLREVPLAPGLSVASDRAYVISGGTRGLGAAFARMLVERGARRLALLGAQALPPRSEWARVADEDSPDGQKVRALRELEARGATVLLYTGRLTDRPSLRRFLGEVRTSLGPIAGVLHCAGAVSDESPAFLHKTRRGFERVLEPKLEGTHALADLLEDDRPDFFVLFSSVSAVIPSLAVGLSDYALANAFLDRFAELQHRRGRTWFRSFNWPSFRETGFGEATTDAYRTAGLAALTVEQGFELLDGALGVTGAPVVLPCIGAPVLTSSAPAKAVAPVATARPAKQELPPAPASSGGAGGGRAAAYAALVRIFSAELKLAPERFRGDVRFEEYGADSVLIASAVKQIEKVIGTPFEPGFLLEHPTLDSLSALLVERYPERFAGAPPAEAPRQPSAQVPPPAPPALAQPFTGAPLRTAPAGLPRTPAQFVPPSPSAVARAAGLSGSPSASAESPTRAAPIAIVGMACRFPGAEDKDRFWDNLARGECSIREVPRERWDASLFYSPEPAPGRTNSKWGGFVDGIDLFDPAWFRITESLAPQLDPLQRLMLETSLLATLDAGYTREELSNRRVGVYVGTRVGNYMSRVEQPEKSTIVGVGQNFIGARISDYFNWRGNNVVIDSACSSSLVSVHLACQALREREIDAAVAGGVDIMLDELTYLTLSAAGALSPDGRCHTFDERANGFVPGEGVGALMLKRLDDALRDGDRVYAVIRGSAVNNDGRTMGITTPNMEAQVEVIEAALAKSGLSAADVSYVEAHGTGTMIGDPIELKALATVFRRDTDARGFCAVGSVKTNIGHLLSAAGVAGLVKTALSLDRKLLPPTLHCERPNPRFAFDQSPFYVNRELRPWAISEGQRRRAGISAFGFGGTNCHMVLEEHVGTSEPRRAPLPAPAFKKRSYLLPARRRSDAGVSIAAVPPPSNEAPLLRFEPLASVPGEDVPVLRFEPLLSEQPGRSPSMGAKAP